MLKWYTFYDRSKLKEKIDYITHRPGVEYVDVRNLSTYRGNYAEQFNETFRLYGKRTDKDKPQYYGIIVNYDPQDNPSPKDVQEACVRLMEITFPDFECVIATHTNTGKVHTHIIMNSVNLVTGFKLEFNKTDRKMMKEEHIKIGESYGYTHTRVIERSPDYRTSAEEHILARGGWSWKEDIRKFVKGAIEDVRVTTLEDFMAFLSDYNMEVLDSGKGFLYFHPKVAQGVCGKKLGPYYTRKSVMAAIERNREAAERREVERRETERREAERQEAEKTPSISRLDEYNKIEVWFRYAEREIKNNYLYYDFNDFVEKVEEIEKRGNLVTYVSDCIDDAIKNPMTEKDYGELTSEDFYREKRYALFCGECVRDKMEPVNRDTFYRDNGWEDTENRAKQEPVGQEGNKAVSIDMLDDYTKVDVWFRYAENSVKSGRSWIDFDNLVEYVKDAERRDCLDLSLFGYIEVGFRNPVTEKDYGELSSVEYYHEKCYALSVEECKRDNKIPLSRDDFYRDKSWGVPESLARLEAERQEAGNHEVENHEVENHEVENHEVENHEVASQEVASQEAASEEVGGQEDNSWEDEEQEDSWEDVNLEDEKPVSIDQLDDYSKVSAWFEYAKDLVECGMPYFDFQIFEICAEFNGKSSSFAKGQKYVEEAFRNPTTEKEYGGLNSTEFYHEKCYELYLVECEKNKKSPLSREDFYREKVWTVPKCFAEQSKATADTVSIDQLDERTRIAVWFRYAEEKVKKGESYLDYAPFVRKIREDEKARLVEDSVRGYIEDGLRNPVTKEEYGELSTVEFYHEMQYILFVDQSVRQGAAPYRRDEFYSKLRYNIPESLKNRPDGAAVATIGKTPSTDGVPARGTSGREEPKKNGTSENPPAHKQNAVSIDMLDKYTLVYVWFKYSEDLLKAGELTYEFDDFADWAKEAESEGSLPPNLRGYIEEGIKFPATEKDYGKLSPEEFRKKKDYELECLYRRLHYMCSVSMEEYYRQNNWTIPDSLKKRRDNYMGK